MRTTLSSIVGAAALLLAVCACSNQAPATTPPDTSSGSTSAAVADAPTSEDAAPAGDDRAAVEKTFTDYNAALVARDFTTACSLTAPSAVKGLIDALAAQGAQVGSCEDAFKAVYSVPQAADPLDEAAKSSQIDDVAVNGDTATVTYHGSAAGQTKNGLTNKMQRIDGQWKLLGNDA